MLFLTWSYLLSKLRIMIYIVPAVLFAIICHEYAHGWVSEKLGDPTPRMSGRLSLNPLKHLDFWGTICLLFFHVGWAKPVPVNPGYYKNRKKGTILVSLAGPISNFIIAFICLFLKGAVEKILFVQDGVWYVITMLLEYSARINVSFAIFNLIPIPPLDGSKILRELSISVKIFYAKMTDYWKWILLILIITGILSRPILVANQWVFEWMWHIVKRLLGLYVTGSPEII